VNAATIALTDSAAATTVAFQGNTTATTGMTVGAGTAAYNVALTGSSNTITGAATFLNTGTLLLGDALTDTILFTAGLTVTAPSLTTVNGAVTTTNAAISLGNVTTGSGASVGAGTSTITINGGGGALDLGTGTFTSTNAGTAIDIQNATTVKNSNLTATSGTINIGAAANLTGAVTQNGGTVISANSLTGSTATAVTLGNANTVTNLGAFGSNGTFTFNNAGALNVSGAVTATNNGLASITATGGTLAVTGTGSVAGTGVTLVAAGAGSDVTLSGAVNGNAGPVTVTAARNVTENTGGDITTSGNVNLTGTAGNVTQTGAGKVTGALLTASSATGTTLNAANTVTSFNATNTTSGNIALINTAPTLTITGISETGGGNVSVTNTGDLTVSNAITTADSATGATGAISLTTASGNVIVNAAVTTGSSTIVGTGSPDTATSGLISVSSAGGITGNASGRLITGGATVTGAVPGFDDHATSGAITLTATGGAIQLASSDALTVGVADVQGGSSGTTANVGSVTVTTATKFSSDGTTGKVDVNFGTASVNIGSSGTATAGQFIVTTTTGGAGAAGGVYATAGEKLTLGAISASGEVNIATTAGDLSAAGAIATTDGTVALSAASGDLTVGTAVNAGGAGSDVTLTTTTSGNVILTGTTTAADQVTVNSVGAINGAGLVTAAVVDLNAASGIGNTTALNLAAPTITADSTTGNLDLNNALGTAVAVTSLTTGTGTINFDQSGGGAVTYGTATTTAGSIVLTSDSANLTVGTAVNAGGAGSDVTLTTTTSGNVILTGTTTAADQVTVNSVGAITDGNAAAVNITATSASLTAGADIGAVGDPLELTVGSFSANAANIYLANTGGAALAGITTAGDFSFTASGNITTTGAFSVNGNMTLAATGENDITISNSITHSNGAAGALSLVAGRSIIFDTSADVTGLGGGVYNVSLNSDRNADGVVGGAISLGSGTVINSAGGSITLGGGATPATVAAVATATNVEGVLLDNAQLLSGAGNISIRGQGNNSAGDSRHGVSIAGGSVVESSTGLVAITAIGGTGGNLNIGVDVNGAGSRVTSTGAGGNISIAGTGGNGTGDSNVGVAIRTGGTVNSTGTGTITIVGARGTGMNNNESVYIDGTVASVTGNIQVTGNVGGTVTGVNNVGVRLAGGLIESTGAATVTVTGTGGSGGGADAGHGVYVTSTGDRITSVTGNVGITGTAGAGAGSFSVNTAAGTTVDAGNGTILVDGNDGALSLAGALTTTNATGVAVTIRDATTAALGDITTGALGTVVLGIAGADNISGAVTQTGIITAGTLTGVTGSTVTLNGSNVLSNLSAFTTDGTFTLNNAGALNVTGAINSGIGGVTISTTAGALSIGTAGDITAGDVVSLTGVVGINTAGDITTSDDNVTFNSATLLQMNAVVIDTGAGAGNITFASTLDGGQDLTLTAGTGSVTFSGVVGATRLGDVTIASANNVTATTFSAATLTQAAGTGTTTLNGAVNTNAAGGISLTGTNLAVNNTITTTGAGPVTVNESGTATFAAAGDINADGAVSLTATGGIATAGDVTTTNDDVTYASATTLTGNIVINAGAGNVAFNSTLNGAFSLDANSTGTTTFGGAVGVGTALTSLTTNAGGATAINGGAVTTTGAQTYGDAVTLGVATTLIGVGNTFSSTVNGPGALTVNDSGTTTFTGAVGGGTALTSLTTNAGGTTAINGGAVTTTGAQTYGDAVTLGAATTLTGVGNTFANTVNGAQTLSIVDSGTTTFSGAVGGGTALTSLTTNAGGTTAINGGAVTTTGAQTYGDAVTLGVATTLIGVGNTFSSTVNGPGALTVNDSGTTTFTGAVGTTTALASLTTNAGGTTAINGGAVTTSGAQTYNDAVTLGAATTLTGVGNTFASTVNGAQTLSIIDSGTTTFNGAVGGGTALTSLTTNAGGTTAINGGAVTTTGAQSYGDAVTLNANTTLITTNSAVAFASILNSFNATARNLTINTGSGAVTFGGTIGGVNPLGILTINNTAAAGLALPTTTVQTLNATTNGAITQSGNLVVAGNTTLAPGPGNNVTLTQAGNNFGGPVGVTNGNNVTLVDANILDLGPIAITGNLTATATTGDITNTGGALLIGGNSLFTASAVGASISVNNAGNNFTGTVTFAPTVGLANVSVLDNSPFDLLGNTISGNLTVNAVGNITDSGAIPTVVQTGLASFNANGFNITLDTPGNNFSTVQLAGAAITLFNVNSINFAGVQSSGAINLQSAGTMTISNPITGGSSVTLGSTAGDLVINAPISTTSGNLTLTAAQNVASTAPGTLTTAGGSITVTATSGSAQVAATSTSGGAVTVTAAGAAQFISPLTISGPFLVNAGGNITFDQSIGGGGSLTANTSGITRFSGPISGLNSLLTNVGGSTILGGGSLGVTGSFRFNDPVQLASSMVISGPTGRFNSTLDGGQGLTVNLSGDAIFVGAIGGSQRLGSITTDSAGRTLFYGGSVLTTGAQVYNDSVLLGTNTTMGASALTFNGPLNTGPALTTLAPLSGGSAATTGESDLTANVSGATVFNAPVGQTTRLGDVTTDAAGTTIIRANFNATRLTVNDPVTFDTAPAITIDTTGAQLFAGTATLGTNLTFKSTLNAVFSPTASDPEGIRFAQGLSAPGRTVTITAPQATISTGGDIGAANARLNTISATGRYLVIGGSVWAQGDIALGIGTGTTGENDFLQFTGPAGTVRNTFVDSLEGDIILGSGATGGAAKTDAPGRSSISKRNDGDLYLFARKVTIQPFERLVVRNGSLIAIADGTAADDGITLSSTAASNYLVLVSSTDRTVPGIILRSRGPANIDPPGGTVTLDQGTDLIAGAVLFFNVNYSLAGTFPTREAYAPAPATEAAFDYTRFTGNILGAFGPLTIGILPDGGGVAHNVYVADLVLSNRFRPILGGLIYLDLSTAPGFGTGPFIQTDLIGLTDVVPMRTLFSRNAAPRTNLQSAFTPNVPREDRETTPPEVDLSPAVREQLQALGIYARALRPEETRSRELRMGLFTTIPERERPRESDYEVADARVENRAVREVLRLATEAGLIGEGQGKLEEVARALAASYEAFSVLSLSQEAKDFRAWLEVSTEPDSMRVLEYVKTLHETLKGIELLGLTRQELASSKAQIYGSILRARLNAEPEFLRSLVEGAAAPTQVSAVESPSVASGSLVQAALR